MQAKERKNSLDLKEESRNLCGTPNLCISVLKNIV
jgi:hypothetical protein